MGITGHRKQLVWRGRPIHEAAQAIVFVHGRGATAESILELGSALEVDTFAWVAPQASGGTWYPYSFMAPMEQNEPGLSTGLQVLKDTVEELGAKGIPAERVHLTGFSQGACLLSEFLARTARRYAGAYLFCGGVIGPDGTPREHQGDFGGTPVFLGCGDRDPHVPEHRVRETAALFTRMGAQVSLRIYPGMPHTITMEEITEVNGLLGAAGLSTQTH